MKHHLAVTRVHCILHIHGISSAHAFCLPLQVSLILHTMWNKCFSVNVLHSSCGLWPWTCILLVAAHQNFPLQTEKWRSSTKQLIWLSPTSYWLTPWMKKLHPLNPLCLAFEWQKIGNTSQPADWRIPAARTSFLVFKLSCKMCTRKVHEGGLVMPLKFQSSRVILLGSWILFMTFCTLRYICFPFLLFMWDPWDLCRRGVT